MFLTNWIQRCKDLIQGHTGAQLILAQLVHFKEREEIRSILLAKNIKGEQIERIYKDECKQCLEVFIAYFTEELINV